MGRRRHRGEAGRAPDTAPSGARARGRVVAVLAVVAAAAALAFMTWRSQPSPATSPVRTTLAPEPARDAVTQAAPERREASSDAPAEYRPLLGEWVRPDGGYVLAVTDIAADGEARVAYFNPRPIHVERAEARAEDGALGLFIELRDRNYPGSTYTLRYDAEGDQLVGVYFQALQRASYDVVFVRRR
jgi:hypothetical protein